MIKYGKYPLLALLVALFATSRAFDQKKNSITYQLGALNHFYDKEPILMNTKNLGTISRVSDLTQSILIKSWGIKYTRSIDDISNIGIEGSFFRGAYLKRSNPIYKPVPALSLRKWHFLTLEYNRKIVDKTKFQLLYGGGLTYRNGFEMYRIFSIPTFIVNGHVGYESFYEFVEKKDLGITLNINLKHTFWKHFFLYSRLDTQLYFYEFESAKQHFKELLEKNPARKYPPRRKINHTLTIGVGMDF